MCACHVIEQGHVQRDVTANPAVVANSIISCDRSLTGRRARDQSFDRHAHPDRFQP
jgi:hypothetical protein